MTKWALQIEEEEEEKEEMTKWALQIEEEEEEEEKEEMTKWALQIAPFPVLLARAGRASGTFPENIDGQFSLAQASVKARRVTLGFPITRQHCSFFKYNNQFKILVSLQAV